MRFSAVNKPSLYIRQSKRGLKMNYYCKFLSFSLRDLMECMKHAKAKRQEHNFFTMPFLNGMSFSEEELGRELNTLREANLIRPIRNVFDPDGDIRFVLSDHSLEEMTDRIWTIFMSQLDMVLLNINYLRKTEEKEKEWLYSIFGKRKADDIINDAYESRRSFKKKDKDETLSYDGKKSYVKGFVEAINKAKNENEMTLNKYCRETIRKNAFPVDLIGEVLLEKDFFSNRK